MLHTTTLFILATIKLWVHKARSSSLLPDIFISLYIYAAVVQKTNLNTLNWLTVHPTVTVSGDTDHTLIHNLYDKGCFMDASFFYISGYHEQTGGRGPLVPFHNFIESLWSWKKEIQLYQKTEGESVLTGAWISVSVLLQSNHFSALGKKAWLHGSRSQRSHHQPSRWKLLSYCLCRSLPSTIVELHSCSTFGMQKHLPWILPDKPKITFWPWSSGPSFAEAEQVTSLYKTYNFRRKRKTIWNPSNYLEELLSSTAVESLLSDVI